MSATLKLKIATLAFALSATQTFAHAQLEKATPAVGGTVTSPSEIRLEFNEGVEPRFSGVTLTAAGGGSVPLGQAKLEAGHQEVLVTPIAKSLSPGVYTVHWRAVTEDSHHTQQTFQFTAQ